MAMTGIERIREIDRQMSTLNQERMQLRETEIDELQKKLRVTVGLCFRLPNGDCVKIIDVPQKQYTMMRTEFNEYQLPVLKVLAKGNTGRRLQGYDLIPLEEDTLFSRAADSPNPVACLVTVYKRITPEEFDAELERCFEELRQLGRQ